MMRIAYSLMFGVVVACAAAFFLPSNPSMAAGKLGAVVMHGKGGTPDYMSDLINALNGAGITAEAQVMPWGQGRIYDKTYEQSMAEIDGLVAKLKAKGADRILIIGHSMGGNATLGYIIRHPEVAGAVIIAAGHQPENPFLQRHAGFDESVSKAKDMIDAGKGDEKSSFADYNMGDKSEVETTANIYYSWFAESGPANMVENAKKYTGKPPVLWINSQTELQPRMKAHHHLTSIMRGKSNVTYKDVDSNHFEAPNASTAIVLEWLKTLS